MTDMNKGSPEASEEEDRRREPQQKVRAHKRLVSWTFAVGTRVTSRPPHRSVRAQFGHTAPTSGV